MFLDEPTLGLDVNAARELRAIRAPLAGGARHGAPCVLTTHYMAEADELCDRIAIIDRGRILATDTPSGAAQPGARPAAASCSRCGRPTGRGTRSAAIAGRAADLRRPPQPERGHAHVARSGSPRDRACAQVLERQLEGQRGAGRPATHDTTLEDVFMAIVGRGLEDTEATDERLAATCDWSLNCAPPPAAPTCASSGASREPSWIISEPYLPILGMCAYVCIYRASARRARTRRFAVLGG